MANANLEGGNHYRHGYAGRETWYSFTIETGPRARAVGQQLQRAAMTGEAATLQDAPVGVFVRRRRGQDTDEFFFTPSAAIAFRAILDQQGGRPCEAPARGAMGQEGALHLSLGDVRAWDLVQDRATPLLPVRCA